MDIFYSQKTMLFPVATSIGTRNNRTNAVGGVRGSSIRFANGRIRGIVPVLQDVGILLDKGVLTATDCHRVDHVTEHIGTCEHFLIAGHEMLSEGELVQTVLAGTVRLLEEIIKFLGMTDHSTHEHTITIILVRYDKGVRQGVIRLIQLHLVTAEGQILQGHVVL